MLADKRYGDEMTAHDRSEAPMLLARIAAEVVECADLTSALQEEMCPDRPDLSTSEIVSLQKLDLIDQTLRNLATVLEHFSRSMPNTHIDLAHVLRDCSLAALASRLGGVDAPANEDDFELF